MQPNQHYTTPPTSVPTNRQGRMFKVGAAVLIIVLFGLSTLGLVMQQKQAKDAKQQTQNLETRIATLEAEDTFAQSEVAKDRYQAVFLTNDQVYFAKITKVTKDSMKIEDIYYLNTGSVDKAGNVTSQGSVALAKLGSELHAPEDVMILERKNVTFWENLKPDGQVAKAIDQYKKSQ